MAGYFWPVVNTQILETLMTAGWFTPAGKGCLTDLDGFFDGNGMYPQSLCVFFGQKRVLPS